MSTTLRIHLMTLALILMSGTALSAEPSNYIFFAETPTEIACSHDFLLDYAEHDTDFSAASAEIIPPHVDTTHCDPAPSHMDTSSPDQAG